MQDYDITTLKEIAKRYTPDSRGYVYKWMDVERIISYIVERSDSLSKKGSVFISDWVMNIYYGKNYKYFES